MVVDVCENPYVLNILLFVEQIIKVVYYIIPLGLIVFMMIDFFKGVISQGDSGSKELIFSFKRIFNIVALFLVPTFVSIFMQFLGYLEIFDGDYAACLKNTSNVSYYSDKYVALELKEEEKKKAEQQKQLEEYEYNKELAKRKKLDVKNTSSSSVTIGQTYNLSDAQIRKLTAVCIGEQGAYKDGVASEASFMANKYELVYSNSFSNIYDWVTYGGKNYYFATRSRTCCEGEVTDELINVVRDVLINGHRTIPLYIDSHDQFSDISYINNGGSNISSGSSIRDRNNYIKDKTKIYTVHKLENSNPSEQYFIFYDWAKPTSKTGDPFGYTEFSYKKING